MRFLKVKSSSRLRREELLLSFPRRRRGFLFFAGRTISDPMPRALYRGARKKISRLPAGDFVFSI